MNTHCAWCKLQIDKDAKTMQLVGKADGMSDFAVVVHKECWDIIQRSPTATGYSVSGTARRLPVQEGMDIEPLEQERVTTDGEPADPGLETASAPKPIDPETGQHGAYWVLSEEERDRGFIRPVRHKYVHSVCGVETKMSTPLAETYARDPKFYGATFCTGCNNHFPVGAHGDFVWSDTEEKVGT